MKPEAAIAGDVRSRHRYPGCDNRRCCVRTTTNTTSWTGFLLVLGAWACSVMSSIAAPVEAATCDVRAYGAVGDGVTFDTEAIQAAIDDCALTGGRVSLPTGQWLTGTLELRSNIELHLSGGAVLLGSTSFDDYRLFSKDPRRTDPRRWYRAHLVGVGIRNVIISGSGIIDGQGQPFWEDHYARGRTDEERRPERQISLTDCHNVRVENVTLVNTAMYGLVFQDCDDVDADGVSIRNPAASPNTDGIVIRDTKNAIISGVRIDTGDDAIVVKSDDRSVDNLLVTDSIIRSDNAGLKFGTAGRIGVSNSLFSDIIIHDTRHGIALYQIDGGAFLDNRFHNIRIETGGRTNRHYPIYVDIDRRRESTAFGRLEQLSFSRIDIESRGNIVISGHPASPIEGLTLEDITFRIPPDAYPLSETNSKPRGSRKLKATSLSEDHSAVPAQLVLTNINDLRVDNLRIRHRDSNQPRSVARLRQVHDAILSDIDIIDLAAGGLPVIDLEDISGIAVRDLHAPGGTSTLIRERANVEGLSLSNVSSDEEALLPKRVID